MASELLSPAEAALLLEPSSFSGGKCLQAALLTLLGRGHVEIGETGTFLTHRTMRVRDGDGEALAPHIAVVKHALMAEGRHRVLKASEVARTLQRAFGSDYRQYVHEKLAPELIGGGLLRREDRKFLGLIPYVKYHRTVEGQRRADRLAELMGELGNMKRLVRDNPYRARRLAEAAGVLLVLSPAARAQAPKLKAMLERETDGGSSHVSYSDSSDGGSTEWEIGVDVGDMSFATDAFTLFDGVASVGDFTGGDGGGDGGDGGGGD
jgi:hypothetical protein